MEKLTEREQQAYDFIVNYFKDNGFSPSYQEIAEGIYYGSSTSVSPIIRSLKDKGYIELPFKATPRAIKVVGMEHAIGQAISLDRIKRAREDIENINPVYSTIGDRIPVLKNCDDIKAEVLEILDRLISEVGEC